MSQSRGKITTNESFLTATSTHWVTLVRLALIVLPCFASFASFSEWLYNPFFLSVLIRPHQCLSQLEEAHAIRTLASNASSTRTFSSYYVANDSVRIPPLAIAFFSPFLETTSNPELWLALFLLVVDFSIAYLLEQVGTRLLGLLSSCESPASSDDDDNDDNNNNNNDDNTRNKRFKQSQRPITEEELQQKLPESIRPPFSNIFPIYRHNKSSSDGTVAKQDSSCLSKPEQTPLIPMTSLPLLAAQLYYWSPFTALPACLYSCWQNVPTLFLVASIDESVRYSSSDGSLSMSSFYLAAAAYLEPHHVVYALPIVLVLLSVVGTGFTGQQQQQQPEHGLTNVRPIAFFVLCFGVWSVLLQGVSCSLVGPSNYWKVARSIYGNTWLTTSPNLSLQWYFRMQVFARFRDYFGAIFALVPYVLMGPIGLRFQRYPEVQFAMWTMVWTIYRPVQVLFDMNVALCFFLFSPRSLARMGYGSVIALCCIPVPLFLNIVDHWMWLDANNGNANYIFFQCLAHNVFLGIILGQFTSASMKRDKALRLTYRKEVSEETKETKKGSN